MCVYVLKFARVPVGIMGNFVCVCVRLNEFQHLHAAMCCTDGQRLTELGTDGLAVTLGSFHSLTPDGARTERERETKTEMIVCYAINITRTHTSIEISGTARC